MAWAGAAAAILVTAVAAVLFLRGFAAGLAPVSSSPAVTAPEPAVAGVVARLTAGGVTATRRLPTMAFALGDGEALDPRLPPGPFSAEFLVTIEPGPDRRARLGAEIQGGELTVERLGRTIAAGSAGREPVVVLGEPVFVPGPLVTFVYRFRATGDGPARLRGLWRPEDAGVVLPLPCDGGAAPVRDAESGFEIAQRLNCAACHRVGDPDLRAALLTSPAPRLAGIGARARPGWIRRWLTDPQALKPGAGMPALFGDGAAAHEQPIEDLTHFLASLGGPMDAGADAPAEGLFETGRTVYHRVGCFACHGPLESPEADDVAAAGAPPGRRYAPLGPLSLKTDVAHLAAFLKDPLRVRPSGRMPSMSLTDLEAESVAAYLIERDRRRRGTTAPVPFVADPERVERGRAQFAARGCADCHDVTPGAPAIASTLSAPALAELAAAPTAGCLAPEPRPGVPDFRLSAAERAALRAFVGEVVGWRSPAAAPLRVGATLRRLDCLACHRFHGAGGPGPAADRHFVTLVEADLGDEGRLPPDLSRIGWQLRPHWLRAVLLEGATARPYMAARMPRFGAAVEPLVEQLGAVAGAAPGPAPPPEPAGDPARAEVGRQLVGGQGFNCIQCHAIAGRSPTDLPGPDLVQMVERLRYDYFRTWVHEPRRLRPGTRMPGFFHEGRSGLAELDHDASAQIEAIWLYLAQGEFLPLPDGLTGPGSYELAVGDRPVVFRTFMEDVGPRAIACGYPEGVHLAFDADHCALRLVWTGRFLNAAGAWAARGGSETDPDQAPVWTGPARPAVKLAGGASAEPPVARFRGYRLDDAGRPVFLYDLRGGGAVVSVREQPIPRRTPGGRSLVRRFELTGPPGAAVVVGADARRLVLDGDGAATFSLEITWTEPDAVPKTQEPGS